VTRPRLVHLTTTDMSLDWLLGPQLDAFVAAGYEVFGMSAPGPHVSAIEARGVCHVSVDHATRAMAPHWDVRALGELVRSFRGLRPDIVHTHNPKPGVYGRLAARTAGVPVVVNTVHGLYAVPEDPFAKRAVVYGLERVASACSQCELVQNPEDIGQLRRLGVPRHKLVLLGNGIDLERFDPASVGDEAVACTRNQLGVADDALVVGAVGRLVWEKGYRELFEAVAIARRRVPALTLVVVGPSDPDKADAVDGMAMARARDEAGVVLAGERHDMEAVYRAMDLYALASWREGYPRSAMEAAAMGLPIVATDIRGCRQVVDHGRTGLLVPVRDARSLAEALVLLATDDERRGRMAAAARRLAVARFDQQRLIDVTLSTYRRLLSTTSV
jgi:glycosyltransferase involved in cell wall biosynthesis